MWSLVLDLLASTVFEWRLWKWIHDPLLRGDRPSQPEDEATGMPNHVGRK